MHCFQPFSAWNPALSRSFAILFCLAKVTDRMAHWEFTQYFLYIIHDKQYSQQGLNIWECFSKPVMNNFEAMPFPIWGAVNCNS